MPGIVINVGETEAEAKAKVDYLIDKMHPDVGRLMLSEFLEADLRDVALDKPFPMDSSHLFECLDLQPMQSMATSLRPASSAARCPKHADTAAPGDIRIFKTDRLDPVEE